MGSNIKDFLETVKKNRFTANDERKRQEYLEWDEYFMAMTFLELRKHTHKTDAAIILNQRKIITSIACSTDDNSDVNEGHQNEDILYFSHAAYKAVCKTQEAAVMYTTSFPCEKCAEAIVEAGISEIVYYRDGSNSDKVKEWLEQCGVTFRAFVSKKKKIEIDFNKYYDD